MNERDLLLEIGTEEIPSRFVAWAREELASLARQEFASAHLKFRDVGVYGTPRRLALFVRGVAINQDDLVQEHKGPAWAQSFDVYGHPTNAGRGFAKSRGVPVESLEKRVVEGVPYAFVLTRIEGRPTAALLPELLDRLLRRIVFPKNMYWDDPGTRFARPIRWLLCLWDDEVIPLTFAGCVADRFTSGHRFLGQKRVEVPSVRAYMDLLYDNYVIVDQDKRRERMTGAIAALEKEIDGKADLTPALVEENLDLVEYPVPFFGTFEDRFLDMPPEVLTTTMAVHQRYFPVHNGQGKLLPLFVGVSNNRATSMAVVREGNERVLRARLSDAAFFWAEDQKRPLASRVEELGNIVYQERLGTLLDKSRRTQAIARHLGGTLGLDEGSRRDLERSAFLAKADLVTHMVYEFGELRGVMGREYARKSGENDRVARAIYEQYLPAAAGDRLPSDILGALLGVADRMDTVVACHKVGLDPTGSQDPYGLRRAARCMNEIFWGLSLDVDLKELVRVAAQEIDAGDDVVSRVESFLQARLQVQLKERGYPHDVVTLAMGVAWHRPLHLERLLDTLQGVASEAWFQALVTAACRVRNILTKAGNPPAGWREELLQEEGERHMAQAVADLSPEVHGAVKDFDWRKLTEALARLEPPVTEFFEKVLVMAEDGAVRSNRLGILASCHALFLTAGDLSRMKK